MALSEVLLAVMTQCPSLTLRHTDDVKVQAVLKREQTFKSPPDEPLIVPHLRRHFILSVRQNQGGLVLSFSLEALSVSALMRVEGDTFVLGTSRLLDGSLLGSSGQAAHLLIGGPFLGSLPCGGETLKFGFLMASRCLDSLPERRKF